MPDKYELKDSLSLGLSLVYTLAEQLEGKVDIVRHGGTTFRVTFPMGVEK
jgi:two-component sensor histidine kinase